VAPETRLTVAQTPKGNTVRFWTRPDINDEALVNGILGSDEYRLAELPDDLDGEALDIGAHVGTVGIALAVDHPRLRVVMVEPIPDNAELCRKSADLNGVGDRVTVIEAMAGHGVGTAVCRYAYTNLEGFEDQQYVRQNAMIGNIWRLTDDEKVDSESVELPIVTAKTLDLGDDVVYVKVDCEGCEWEFLKGVRYPLIVGECHDAAPGDIARVLPHHTIEVLEDYGGSGIFRATL
jgi:FkbM family methyltransferase